MKESGTTNQAEQLQVAYLQALRLVDQLQALTADAPPDRLPWLLDLIVQAQEAVTFLSGGAHPATAAKHSPTPQQLLAFGKLLRDRRNKAGFSRIQLARRAKLSDSTIKFLETARHPPSRATLIRLLGVEELKLTEADAPGAFCAPAPARDLAADRQPLSPELNCLITPTFDPVRRILELGRFLNGAGGHVAQINAYLDHQSAAAYLALCNQSAAAAVLRADTPLCEAARRIVAHTGPVALNVIALGSGAATLEVRLVRHLLEQARVPSIELCLVDGSQPLLACGQRHAAETLADTPNVRVWGMPCHFDDLPLYSRLLSGADQRPAPRRVFCLLGGTFADVDNELRFFRHSLPPCTRGDLLLLDMQVGRGSPLNPAEIQKRDKQWSTGVTPAESAWLSGPIRRHCQDVVRVDFHWNLDTHCPIPGSYALDAVAKVQLHSGAERSFSMFRFRRYAPDQVSECLRGLGWEEIAAMPFGSADQPSSLRLFCNRAESSAHE